MPAETKRNLQLEIGHVLFIDMVGYSQLSNNEQSKLLSELNAVVRRAERFRLAEAEGTLVRLPTGDGMRLFFATVRKSPPAALWKLVRA